VLDVSQRIEDQAVRFLRELSRHRPVDDKPKVNSVHVDEYGQAHVRGGMFNATGGRDASLSIAGFTASDITAFRRELREHTGLSLSQSQADSLLMEARSALRDGTMTRMDPEEKREKNRQKIARRRELARKNGICIICTKNPATGKRDGSIGTTCWECQNKATEAKRNRKSAK
jgi:hypothetical protein